MKRISIFLCLLISLSVSAETEAFRKAIKQAYTTGSAEAQYKVAMMYVKGEDVSPNLAERMYWLILAANQDHPEAMEMLAEVYMNGVRSSDGKFVYFPCPAAARSIYRDLKRYDKLAILYAGWNDKEGAALYAEKDCETNPAKYYFLARIYDDDPVEEKLPKNLQNWIDALTEVLPEDKAKALECYTKFLAKVPEDQEETARKIAEKYLKGEGTIPNPVTAKLYFNKAGRDGMYLEAFIFGLGGNACTQNPYVGKHMVEADVQYLRPFTVARDAKTALAAIDKVIAMDQGNSDRLADDYKLKGLIYAAQGNEYDALRMYAKVLDINNQYFKKRKNDPLHKTLFSLH